MGPTVVLRARASRLLGAVMVVVAVLGLGSTLLGGLAATTSYAGPLALFGLTGWAAFWQPHVEVSDGGVRVVNTLRTTEVPWPALEGVDGRYGLRLRTAYGPVQAWGAQPPSGVGRARGRDSEAATAVRARWDQLRHAGYLDHPRLEYAKPLTSWHHTTIAALGAAALASVAMPLLR